MENTPKPTGWLPRFTLRELLLATVAIAAVVALFVQRRPFDQHAMLQSLDPHALVTQICSEQGIELQNTSSQHASGVVFGGGYYLESDTEFSELSFADAKTKVMPKVLANLREAIESDGGDITGHGVAGSDDQSEVTSFWFQYRRGPIRGVSRGYVFELPSGGSRILILMDEY